MVIIAHMGFSQNTGSYSRIAKKIWLFLKYANIFEDLARWPRSDFFSRKIF